MCEISLVNYSFSPWALDDSLTNKELIIKQIYEITLDTADVFADPLSVKYPSSFNYKDMRVIVVCKGQEDNNYLVFYVDPDEVGRKKISVGDTLLLYNLNAYWIDESISFLGSIAYYDGYHSIPKLLNHQSRAYTLIQ